MNSVHRIPQARILEWVAIPSPGNPPDPGIEPTAPALQANHLLVESFGKPRLSIIDFYLLLSIKPIKKQGEMKLAAKDESYRW